MSGQRLQGLLVEFRRRPAPRRNGAIGQGLVAIRYDEVLVELQRLAEAVAFGAGAERVVEREQARLDLRDREAGDGTGELLREDHPFRLALLVLAVGKLGDGEALGQAQGGFQTVSEAALHVRLDDDPVHHHVDIVLEFLVERGGVFQRVELAIDLDPLEAGLQPFGEFLAVLTLAAAHDRGQQVEARAVLERGEAVDHLADRLALDRQAGGRRIGHADPGP